MELKEIIKEAILTHSILSMDEDYRKLPPVKKIDMIIKMSIDLSSLAEKTTSEPDKALGLFGVVPCLLENYKPKYIEWRDKYFKPCNKVYNYQTIGKDEYLTTEQLHKRYEKAMLETPFK